jgi:signal transduction histidine kinase
VAEPRRAWARASVRLRTTLAAVVVVAVVLLAGAVVLVALVRGSLRDGAETTAEQRAAALADQVETSGLPAPPAASTDGDDDEPEDLVWQIVDESGRVVSASQALPVAIAEDADEVRLPGADAPYVVVTEDARSAGTEYVVAVAASLEEVEDSTAALVPPLLVGLPMVLLVVGGTTWLVATQALSPVDRIRREVEQITDERLDRRVPEPASRDEIHRLARTMNQMLGRLETSRDRQRQFVADASHELRSPLASIRQSAEVARTHPGAMPEGELADVVLEEAVRMQRLIEQLLLLTRADEGALARDRHDVDIDDIALTEGARLRRTGVVVDASAVGAGRVRGDAAALGQVVRNLVDNAARHAAGRVALTVAQTGSTLRLTVDDDGPGVPEADRERIFERFVRLDEARARDAGGSGLGLAIVREIVMAHGGSVAVADSDLGGARFVVTLPTAAEQTG